MWEAAPSHLHRDWVSPAGCGAQPWLQNTWGLKAAQTILFQPCSSPILAPHCSHSPCAAMEQESYPEPSPTRCFTPSHLSCTNHGHHQDTNSAVLASSVTSSSLHHCLSSGLTVHAELKHKGRREHKAALLIAHFPPCHRTWPRSFNSLLVLRSLKPLTSPIFPQQLTSLPTVLDLLCPSVSTRRPLQTGLLFLTKSARSAGRAHEFL